MGAIGSRIIKHVLSYPDSYERVISAGVADEHFQGANKEAFSYIRKGKVAGRLPTAFEVGDKFEIDLTHEVEEGDLDHLLTLVKKRHVLERMAPVLDKGMEAVGKNNIEEALTLFTSLDGLQAELVREDTVASYKLSADERLDSYYKAKESLSAIPSLWPSFDKWTGGWAEATFYVIAGFTTVGKCVAENERIVNPETGQVGTMRQAVLENWKVNSLDLSAGHTEIEQPYGWYSGMKDCFTLSTRSGYSLTTSKEHPYLTPSGFKRLEELKEGDRVARAATVQRECVIKGNPTETFILGCLLADGCLTRKGEITFTNSDPEILSELHIELATIGSGLYQRPSQEGTPTHTVKSAACVWEMLSRYGIEPTKSLDKAFPDKLRTLDVESISAFLSGMFNCDGSVSTKGDITLGLSNEQLILGCNDLLSYLGVVCHLRRKSTPRADCWQLRVYSQFDHIFAAMIPLIPRKRANIRKRNSLVGNIPCSDLNVDEMISTLRLCGETPQTFAEKLGQTPKTAWHVWFRRSNVSRKVLDLYEEVTGSSLGYTNGSHVFWDTISSIEHVGETPCYDFECQKNHNFVVNGFVVHNTWSLIITALDVASKLSPEDNVLIVSSEMSRARIARRLDSVRYKLDFIELRDGSLDPAMEERWAMAMADEMESETGDIIIADSQGVESVDDILSLCYRYKPRMVLVDGGYRLRAKGTRGDWERQVRVIEEIQRATIVTNIPWVVTTQLGDGNETGKGLTKSSADRWNVRYAKEWIINPDYVLTLSQNEDLEIAREMNWAFTKMRDAERRTATFRTNWDYKKFDYSEIEDLFEEGAF